MNMAAAAWLFFQVANPYRIDLRDEGTSQGRISALNCTGAGVSCSVAAGVGTLNAAGGAGSANVVQVEVDFGAAGDTTASAVVTGQAWVSGTSVIVCSPTMFATADRDDGDEDAIVEGLTVGAHTRVAGTGFTVVAHPEMGKAYGKFKVHCTGA
jgi:hypothetical protein